MISVNLPVEEDNVVELNETFDIVLSLSPLSNLRIKVDDKTSVEGHIVDSTGKSYIYKFYSIYIYVKYLLLCIIYLCFLVIAFITKNPSSRTVAYENDNITLSCKATASGPITYQ